MLYFLFQRVADIPSEDEWLSSQELATLAKMRFPKRRSDWKLGRWTAKCALQAYLRHPDLPELEIRAAPDGAPQPYVHGNILHLGLSLSHSMGVSLAVISPNDLSVGCDLERVEPRDIRFALDYFLNEEREFLAGLPADHQALYATLIWSAKESALKSLRQGLRRDTKSVAVHFEVGKSFDEWKPLSVRCRELSRDFYGWWRSRDGYVHTLTACSSEDEPEDLDPGRGDGIH